MGMYDHVVCDLPLPYAAVSLETMLGIGDFQTKDLGGPFDGDLATFRIGADAVLRRVAWVGRWIKRPRRHRFSGEVRFYDSLPAGWVEYVAHVEDGRVTAIDLTHEPGVGMLPEPRRVWPT